jgi:hypothetical protein
MTAAACIAILLSGCVTIPERLDDCADAAREFLSAHRALSTTAVVAAAALLKKPQYLGVTCNPHCTLTQKRQGSANQAETASLN